jgi:hypothetical protein
VVCPAQRVRAQGLHLSGHFDGGGGKGAAHRRREVEETHPLRLQANLLQQLLDPGYPSLGAYITFQVMAVTGQSANRHHAVGAILESLQGHEDVELAGTGQLDDLDGGRVLEAQTAGEIGSSVGAVLAAVGDNL